MPNSIDPATRRILLWLRPVVFVACLGPCLWLVYLALMGGLGANPIQYVIRFTGDWTIRLLCAVLALTPLGVIAKWYFVLGLRRMVGLFGFFYASLHILAYLGLDLFFDFGLLFEELAKRKYLWVGLAAYGLLMPLFITSFAAISSRMKPKSWQILHRGTYLALALGIWHFWMMSKFDFSQPKLYAILLVILIGLRLMVGRMQRSK